MRISLSLKYVLSLTLIVLLVLSGIFWVLTRSHEKLVMAQIEMQARSLFQQIVITRRWVADHGGVFVEKLPWVQPNPFLPNPIITDQRGRAFVKENPAMVTKQLSKYAQREGLYFFHITSLKLMNPDNAPDDFEIAALKRFESGEVPEVAGTEKLGDTHYYRYIAPLKVERACLDCHADQGYKIGDIRGAISVSVPMDFAVTVIERERIIIIAGLLLVGGVLVVTLFLATRRIVLAPLGRIRAQMAGFSSHSTQAVELVRTGDELEDLSRAFGEMAGAVRDYHSCLQEKIANATRELTEKNIALEKLHRGKSDFIAKTSHELRTPLTSIKGAMDYLSVKLSMRDTDEDRDMLVFFETIKKSADRLIRLVNNILEYERVELGRREMNIRDVNLKELFHEVVTAFIPLAVEKDVKIRLKAEDITCGVDADRMRQVLTNLLSNALVFSPSGSAITLTLESRNGMVHGSVEDAGCGIPESERSSIFKEFYTRNVSGGTGLGLAICKSIIEAHGGEIGVTGSDKGGSRFWFMVPEQRKGEHVDEKTAACR
ncbi:MAG: DUF3365 domain-containing protein [Nitrospirota bacterium]|nr:DUF3365 domain-containing protein [Nitrospirota bacterium]